MGFAKKLKNWILGYPSIRWTKEELTEILSTKLLPEHMKNDPLSSRYSSYNPEVHSDIALYKWHKKYKFLVWAEYLFCVNFKDLPRKVNHINRGVREVIMWRLQKGK